MILHGWQLSLYSGKARAYLRYKGIPFVEKPPRAWTMNTIRRKTGVIVMPVVETPEGEWLQDTSHIMDVLEQRFPEAPVLPSTPRQRIAALLLEAWGDEFWLPSAMHYRWSFPDENFAMFQREGGDNLLPFAPRFVKNRLIAGAAAQMRSFLPGLGVVIGQAGTIEQWTEHQLDLLEAHFAQHPYLLGSKPSYGDFGLVGPLYAHLGRDPYPKRVLMGPRPALSAWIARMQEPAQPRSGAFLANDAVPPTLTPVLRSIFAEFWPYLELTLAEVAKQRTPAPGRGYRRSLGEVRVPMAGRTLRRAAAPFSLWMAQRPLDAYTALSGPDRDAVDRWLATVGGEHAMRLAIRPRLKRLALHVAPE